VPTKEDVRNVLLEKMSDPGISGDTFDELNRRVTLLDQE
jgi:hypothetical protein